MGGAASSPVSASLSSTTHPRNRTFGATSIVPGKRLPPPYTLNSEDEARAAGYSDDDIKAYKASYEYFQRVEDRGATNSSLPLYDPDPAFLLPGAAGLVLPRCKEGVQSAHGSQASPEHDHRKHALATGPIVDCKIVVVGAGLAAGHLAQALIKQGAQVSVSSEKRDSCPTTAQN